MSDATDSPRFERAIDSPRRLVWRAWTEPDGLAEWYRPDPGWSTSVLRLDLRPGGAYRIASSSPGLSRFHEVGVFDEVASPGRLVYTCRLEGTQVHELTGEEMEEYETLITVELRERAAPARGSA